MNFIENFFGTAALITSIIGLLPQVYKSFKTKSTDDLSMVMLMNYLVCSLSWIMYGICMKSMFVVWSNVVGLITSSVSILMKRKYDKS